MLINVDFWLINVDFWLIIIVFWEFFTVLQCSILRVVNILLSEYDKYTYSSSYTGTAY